MRNQKTDDCLLTVLIPTYNRKKQLTRTLDQLNGQSDKDFKILIFDNASDYSIADEILNQYPEEFIQRITVHRNRANLGADMNIASVLASCDTQWGWLLGDDDAVYEDSVENIKKQIHNNPTCAAFWFSISQRRKDDIRINSLEELIEVLKVNQFYGDWIFMSNKVYNIQKIECYFEAMFFRLYTRITHCIPILELLKNHKEVCVVNSVQIVRHAPIEQDITWDMNSTLMGLRTIMDYNSGLPYSKHKELVKYTMFSPGLAIRKYLKKDSLPWNYKIYLKSVYRETYCRVYQFPINLFLWIIVDFISTPIGFKIGKKIIEIEGKA